MAGKVVDKEKPKGCKDCGKPGFKGKDGKMQHERRGDPAVYGGRRADPAAPPAGAPPKAKDNAGEQEPDRRHFLHRTVFGGGGKDSGRQ